MHYIFSKMKYLIITTVVVLIIFFYFGVFSPLKTELEESLNQNFKNFVSITEINVENKFSRYKEGAESLSSRTMIRNKLEEYNEKDISLQELKDYTQAKYSDGVKVLENIVSAFRITEGEVIANWGEKDFEIFSSYINYDNQTTEIKILQDNYFIIINSMIKKDNIKLGNDIVVFNFKPLMNKINEQKTDCEIVYSEKKIENLETDKLIIDYRRLLNTNYWLKSKISKDKLYYTLNKLSFKIIGGFLFLLLIIATAFSKTLTTTSKKIITELEEKVEKITEISETDDMLGIYNRSKFFDVLKSEIYRSRRYENNLSLIMFDVDRFKNINDEYGHLVGDKVLKKTTEIINSQIRELDLFARYGGDEFMILNPETKLNDAVKLAERVRKKIENTDFAEVKDVSCSFGVAELKVEDDIDSLLKRLDDALYKAKEKRNKVYYFKD
ncbi:diguanylate cyclase (GGDEF) domain-containing protein [Halanaerobium congolense]|uniref:Diguanylate cyclase (GGDEF) domain-containing protein n=2 Tax=Halanaerobium congolense TaxID=54121 RepID=A0A1I0D1F6_9FIRM|nr:GGDEF domain-containing protein [Halanaerobium congolense]PTX14784.1 diguanylate cyclase (GGDEF)-like protein [Halanaerobium congolense]SDG25748.1 diguanylate cyclase (GGDEF) domain-containing protein [Halanaerobium congolense]SET25906.1 diguanylate cyclase (GGDEF) domain-containing protein [Halanaerobium congolense]SFP77037.1 diguanylate cyclase (GGDEF) domain-containing protein [Halanaerobium congolense]